MNLSADLLEILACPKCKSKIKFEGGKIICQGPSCGLRFPVKDGIPVMLIDEAEKP